MDSDPIQRSDSPSTTNAADASSNIRRILTAALAWAVPYENVQHLKLRNDPKKWVQFRNGLLDRWSSLNVVTGLIMGAVSTVVCSSLPLSGVAFALGVVALLSSLISIGFGTGLIYVLGDVPGESLQKIAQRYTSLFPYALAIPQLWAAVCFGVFFIEVCVIAWEQTHAGWLARIGVLLAVVTTVLHLFAFFILHFVKPNIDNESQPAGGLNIEIPQFPVAESERKGTKFTDDTQVSLPQSGGSEATAVGAGFAFIGGFGRREADTTGSAY